MTQSFAMGSSTRGAEASFAFPLKIRAGRGFTVRDLPERARPRAQQRDRARCNRIEQSAQQLGLQRTGTAALRRHRPRRHPEHGASRR